MSKSTPKFLTFRNLNIPYIICFVKHMNNQNIFIDIFIKHFFTFRIFKNLHVKVGTREPATIIYVQVICKDNLSCWFIFPDSSSLIKQEVDINSVWKQIQQYGMPIACVKCKVPVISSRRNNLNEKVDKEPTNKQTYKHQDHYKCISRKAGVIKINM